jgi:hypothetical protein
VSHNLPSVQQQIRMKDHVYIPYQRTY